MILFFRAYRQQLLIGLLVLLMMGLWYVWRELSEKNGAKQRSNLPVTTSSLHFRHFGTVRLYSTLPHPTQVILLISGEHGWDRTMTDIAQQASRLDALVAGVDLPQYLHALSEMDAWCSYPGEDFQALNKFLQKQFAFSAYTLPVLVGYEVGAAFAYATMAQAPPDMFQGVISLEFCPELTLQKPLCQWNGLRWKFPPQGTRYTMAPASALSAPWVVLRTPQRARCTAGPTSEFANMAPHSHVTFIDLPPHAFGAPEHWISQFTNAFAMLVQKPVRAADFAADAVKDLPLIEHTVPSGASTTLAVIFSGDGGWASIDRELGDTLASHGIATVGVNSLRYFWTARTPESGGQDLTQLLQYYLAAWQKETVLLIGYSLGADVLPFFVSRLPSSLLAKVTLIALLAPSRFAAFEFHITDWLEETSTRGTYPILPEIQKLKGKNVVCVYGAEEEDTACREVNPQLARIVRLAGGHHFDGSYEQVADIILQAAGVSQGRPKP